MPLQDSVAGTVRSHLATTAKCSHREDQATLDYIENGAVGVRVCPNRYVSRIIAYGRQLDPDGFKRLVQGAAEGMREVEGSDIRVARRYAWDLGLESKNNDLALTETYWTQNYRRTKSEDPDRPALFLRAKKDSFLVQPLRAKERLCDRCRS